MMPILPLETLFIKKAENGKATFPRMVDDYVTQYKNIVNHLRANFYPKVDAGLAANSNISGFYTAHDAEHFDEVVRYAGHLLGVETGDEYVDLSAYELYMLLVAIRIHDVGNVYGREQHEKKCFSILRECGDLAGDIGEKKFIGSIAQAHGGRIGETDKDTIGKLPTQDYVAGIKIRPRLLASIVRFADEICENNSRAAKCLLKTGSIPKHSEVFHYYAASIAANAVSAKDRRIDIRYEVELKNIIKPWGCATTGPKTETFLIDEIFERLDKMDLERKYCNRFSRELYTIDTIRAAINVLDDHRDIIGSPILIELSDTGYPKNDATESLKNKLSEYCGPDFGQKLQEKLKGAA